MDINMVKRKVNKMKSDEIATWFKEGEAPKKLFELKALLLNEKILGIYKRNGDIELHFDKCVMTVQIKHFSFVEKVEE